MGMLARSEVVRQVTEVLCLERVAVGDVVTARSLLATIIQVLLSKKEKIIEVEGKRGPEAGPGLAQDIAYTWTRPHSNLLRPKGCPFAGCSFALSSQAAVIVFAYSSAVINPCPCDC